MSRHLSAGGRLESLPHVFPFSSSAPSASLWASPTGGATKGFLGCATKPGRRRPRTLGSPRPVAGLLRRVRPDDRRRRVGRAERAAPCTVIREITRDLRTIWMVGWLDGWIHPPIQPSTNPHPSFGCGREAALGTGLTGRRESATRDRAGRDRRSWLGGFARASSAGPRARSGP